MGVFRHQGTSSQDLSSTVAVILFDQRDREFVAQGPVVHLIIIRHHTRMPLAELAQLPMAVRVQRHILSLLAVHSLLPTTAVIFSWQSSSYIQHLMEMNPWYINAGIYEPAWDHDEQKLVWNECSTTIIYLPSVIKTVEEAQELLECSYESEHGSSTYLWQVQDW